MELLIKIPKEFEQHFKQNAFKDSLRRLSFDAHLVAGLYEQEIAEMLEDAFRNAVSVPPHGRLGDLDELHKEAVRRSEKAGTYDSWYNCMDRVISAFDIENAPTIIEADDPKEER